MENDFLQDPALIQEFLIESEELLQRMDQDMIALEADPRNEELLNRIFRALHSIKGTSGFLCFEPVVRLSHRAEDVLTSLRQGKIQLTRNVIDALLAARDQLGRMLVDIRQGGLQKYQIDSLIAELEKVQSAVGPDLSALPKKALPEKDSPKKDMSAPVPHAPENQSAAATLRVDVHKLDDLIDLIGELVLERNRLLRLSRDFSLGRIAGEDFDSALTESTARLGFITEELQIAGLRTRMVPIDAVFRKFPRMVRDMAHGLNKEVELIVRGENTELDKTMAEFIGDPIVHLIRNSLDHGLEMPDVRQAAGKPRKGTIRLEARQEGDQIMVLIADDGAGIDPERIARKAIEKGLVTAERTKNLTAREILDFIFLPGFSTAETVNDLSGRGVGMDVVRSNIKKLNGTINVQSRVGVGTTIELRLPLTLAILPLLLVQAAKEVYGLPLRSVIETAQLNCGEKHLVEGSEVLCLRGQTLPLIRLGKIFGESHADENNSGKVVILGIGEKKVALAVDDLLGQESTIIKPLGPLFSTTTGLSGATIAGDGRVRLVLDPAGLLSSAIHLNSHATGASVQ